MTDIDIAGAPRAFVPLSAALDCEIDQLSSRAGKWRLVLTGEANDINALACVARMQHSRLTLTLREKEDDA